MNLTAFQPRWLIAGGDQKSVFAFLCPCCRKMWLTCKSLMITRRLQMDIFSHQIPNNHGQVVPTDPQQKWTFTGTDFSALTVAPSLDFSAAGHWHGMIKLGLLSE